jgi:uncharacterized delta-60 repeat protein
MFSRNAAMIGRRPNVSTHRAAGAKSRCNRSRPQIESLEGRTLLTAGVLDTSFGGTGLVTTQLAFNTKSQGLVVQPDLKTVVVGLEAPSNTTGVFPHSLVLFRYNVDGSLDSTFGSGGEVVLSTNSLQSSWTLHNAAVALQPDGKIVVATNTASATSSTLNSSDMLVLRFNANGGLDTSFGTNGETEIHLAQGFTTAHGVAVLSNGDIIVAGTDPRGANFGPSNAAVFVVARLTGSGALDTTFGPSNQGYNYTTFPLTPADSSYDVDTLAIDSAGNILLGGNAPGSNSIIDQIVRYTASGLIDTSFANQGVLQLPFGTIYGVEGIGFQSDGQIIAAFSSYNGPGTGGLVRINRNGPIDTSFGANGYFHDPATTAYTDLAIQPDDKILLQTYNVSGGSSNGIVVDRLLSGGTLDPAFGTSGRAVILGTTGGPAGMIVGPDGKITATQTLSGSVGAVQSFRLLGDPPTDGQLVVTQQPPASVTAGSQVTLTVQAEDSAGNIESSFNGNVTVALANNPGGATLGGTLTVTATNGVATFADLTLTNAASGYVLFVSANNLSSTETTPFAVAPANAAQVVITQQPPSSVTAGSGFGLTATIEDAYGNVETGDNANVSVALASGPSGTNLGGTVSESAVNGVATFSGLTLTAAASGYSLAVSSTGLSSATSAAFSVTPAAASKIVITQQPPASVGLRDSFGLVAVIEDAYGNIVTSDSGTVTVALANNPTGAKLGGTTSVKAKNGVVTFSGLTISKVGTGYTLQLSRSGLTGATTSAINVT